MRSSGPASAGDAGERTEVRRAEHVHLQRAVHDLRSPLTNILGSAELLLMQASAGDPLTAKQLRRVRALLGSAKELDALLSGLAELDRIQSGERPVLATAHGAEALVRSAMPLLVQMRGGAELPITIMAGADVPALLVDPTLLSRALLHLLSEALRISGREGHVLVDITRDAANVRFEFHIRSPGLAPEQGSTSDGAEQLEQGIRMAYSRAAIELGGGTLSVQPWMPPDASEFRQSAPAASATFTVSLPAVP